VVELGGGLRLVAEALEVRGRTPTPAAAPSPRRAGRAKLHRLVDHAHPAAPDLAYEAEVAQRLGAGRVDVGRRESSWSPRRRSCIFAAARVDEREPSRHVGHSFGDVGVAREQFLAAGRACPDSSAAMYS
jgi:hypothetical protein